jgi:hypothetical protein
MFRFCRVIPVVLLLTTLAVSATPSAFPDPGPDSVGTGPETFPPIDARTADSPLLETLDAKASANFVSLEVPPQLIVAIDNPLATLSSEMTLNPLFEVFAEPSVMPSDAMRLADVTPPSQPPILVPTLTFFGATQLNVLLVLALAVVLYRFGAKSLRLHR